MWRGRALPTDAGDPELLEVAWSVCGLCNADDMIIQNAVAPRSADPGLATGQLWVFDKKDERKRKREEVCLSGSE